MGKMVCPLHVRLSGRACLVHMRPLVLASPLKNRRKYKGRRGEGKMKEKGKYKEKRKEGETDCWAHRC